MKKLLTTSVLVLGSVAGAFAQTEAGSLLVGSSISQLAYSTSKDGDRKGFTVALTPTVGFFVADRLAVGAELGLGYATNTFAAGPIKIKRRTLSYGISPLVRYYVLDAPKHKFFGQASYGIFGYSDKYENNSGSFPDQKSKDSYWSPSVSVGYNYFIAPMVALEVQPYYRYMPTDLQADVRANQWGVSVGFQIFFPKSTTAAQ